MATNHAEHTERLWVPVAAPVLWALHFTLCYVTAAVWCGRFATMNTVMSLGELVGIYTTVAIAGMVWLFAVGLRRHDYRLPYRTHDDDTPEDRRHFLAFTTMLLSALSVVATVFVAFAAIKVDGCG